MKEKRLSLGRLELAIAVQPADAERIRRSAAYRYLVRPALGLFRSNGHAAVESHANGHRQSVPANPEASAIQQRVSETDWYHTLALPQGVLTPGLVDHRKQVQYYGLPADMRGMRALDVATFDGFWAFEMERRGAEVTAVDIGSWLEADVPRLALQQAVAEGRDMSTGHGFRIAKELLGSKVERHEVSVYDLSPDRIGEFDAVLVSDLLIHLRDPQRALEAVYSVVRPGGYAIIAEPYNAELEGFKDICLSQFIEFSDYTWWSPSTNTLRAMMRIAGFDAIEEVRRFTLNARAPSPITKVVFRAHRKEKGAPNG